MFVCKLRTPSCSKYEHVHVYLAYRRQTGTLVTRQTNDRVHRLTKPPLHTFKVVTLPLHLLMPISGDRVYHTYDWVGWCFKVFNSLITTIWNQRSSRY